MGFTKASITVDESTFIESDVCLTIFEVEHYEIHPLTNIILTLQSLEEGIYSCHSYI